MDETHLTGSHTRDPKAPGIEEDRESESLKEPTVTGKGIPGSHAFSNAVNPFAGGRRSDSYGHAANRLEYQEEFGQEASYKGTNNDTSSFKRPAAPHLSADHVWGVREDWGAMAKDWGKGAKIHESSNTPKNSEESEER